LVIEKGGTPLNIDAPVRACADIAAEIRAMTPAQRVRLRRVAEKYAWLYRDDAEALLQEAFCRALAGERHKPDHVDIVRFLAEAMRSIADGEAQKQENQATIIPIGAPGDLNGSVIELPEPSEGVEDRIMAAEHDEGIRQGLFALFPDDPNARDVIDGIMAGCDGEELRALTDLSPTQYASTRRRIRRTIDRHHPNGRKP
jgi:hypothetical protein